MRLCSYIVRYDRGLAPNPFWGYCTLAICTPNHMGIRFSAGDWILGTTTAARGNKLLYAMQIYKVLSFNDYYRDPKLQDKKPVIKGNWKQRVGDNMYYQDKDGVWQQHPTLHHRREEIIRKDLKHPYVLIGNKFFYFGKNAIELPQEFKALIWSRQGCKINHEAKITENFTEWLRANYNPGIYGNPFDNDEANS